MKRSHLLLFGANAFGTGLLAPVLSLVLLSHGATLENLSLCIGIFAVMVVVLELPSGIMADLIGRKRIFLLSACFMMANYVLLMFSSHFLMLAAACAMQGIGRAFSSGSIEALRSRRISGSRRAGIWKRSTAPWLSPTASAWLSGPLPAVSWDFWTAPIVFS